GSDQRPGLRTRVVARPRRPGPPRRRGGLRTPERRGAAHRDSASGRLTPPVRRSPRPFGSGTRAIFVSEGWQPMKQKNLILMVVAVGCGLVAAFLTSQMSARSSAVEQVEVIVAAKDLPVGTMLGKEDRKSVV